MKLSFDNAEIQQNTSFGDPNKPKVMKPGIYSVVTTELKSGIVDNEKQTPYIDWTVINENKEILTHRYYTSTTINDGKEKSAWDITASQFLQLVTAITNLDKDDARTKLNSIASSSEDNTAFTAKLSALVVGKPFNLKVNGEEIASTNSTTGKFVKSKFGNTWTFALSSKITGDELTKKMGKVYIKPLPMVENSSTGKDDGLPF